MLKIRRAREREREERERERGGGGRGRGRQRERGGKGGEELLHKMYLGCLISPTTGFLKMVCSEGIWKTFIYTLQSLHCLYTKRHITDSHFAQSFIHSFIHSLSHSVVHSEGSRESERWFTNKTRQNQKVLTEKHVCSPTREFPYPTIFSSCFLSADCSSWSSFIFFSSSLRRFFKSLL